MEGGAAALGIVIPSSKTPDLPFNLLFPSSSSSSSSSCCSSLRPTRLLPLRHHPKALYTRRTPFLSTKTLALPPSAVAKAALEAELEEAQGLHKDPWRFDRKGRFSTSRAARELALVTAYASCLEGVDPIRLFDRRVNAKSRRFPCSVLGAWSGRVFLMVPGYEFDNALLLDYDHMSFGGAPVKVGTEEEAEELMLKNEEESAKEAEVLSAPPRLVYSQFVLCMTRDILEAVVDGWNQHVQVIVKIIPPHWKDEPAARILELCILHQAMAEMTAMGTRRQIVISEAVDLAKRFCDGCAPRIINGCLRTFVDDHMPKQQLRNKFLKIADGNTVCQQNSVVDALTGLAQVTEVDISVRK